MFSDLRRGFFEVLIVRIIKSEFNNNIWPTQSHYSFYLYLLSNVISVALINLSSSINSMRVHTNIGCGVKRSFISTVDCTNDTSLSPSRNVLRSHLGDSAKNLISQKNTNSNYTTNSIKHLFVPSKRQMSTKPNDKESPSSLDHNNVDQLSTTSQIPSQPLHVAATNRMNRRPSMTSYYSSSSSLCSSLCSDDSMSSAPSVEPQTTTSTKCSLQPKKQAVQKLSDLDPRANPNKMCPDVYIGKLFRTILDFALEARPTLEISSLSYNDSKDPFMCPITEDELANYDVEVVSATRDEDLNALRALHSSGRSLSCCNRYGESLMHMACRRGFYSIVKFLKDEAGVSIRITDDCGRTPMHDALWHKECQYETVDLLLTHDPSLLLLCDKHGHTPFAYARREHWEVWKQFLWDRREHIQQAVDPDVMELFRLKL